MQKKILSLGCALSLSVALSVHGQTVDELVSKNIQAHGGPEKLKAVHSLRLAGKMNMGGMEAPFTLQMKDRAKLRMEIVIQGKTIIDAFDGEIGWGIMPLMGSTDPQKSTEEDNKRTRQQADWDGPLVDYKEKGNTVESFGKEDVEGTEMFKLKVTLKNGDIQYTYLDPETWLEAKTTTKITREGTEVEMDMIPSNYSPEGGVMIAHSIDIRAKGAPGGQNMTIEKVEVNPAVDDSIFVMPPKSDSGGAAKQ